ncbi:MAG: hypothetical protein JKY50_12385 [Oleispira sp.]|nr:hypothetical protein [Oleispira sp.]
MYNNIKITNPVKTAIIFLLCSSVSLLSYSAEPEENSDESYIVETFNYFVSWMEKELKYINDKYLSPESVVTEEPAPVSVIVIEGEPSTPLDLTIPAIDHEGSMALDEGQPLNFPDLFSEPAKKRYIKEQPSASFGGSLLMDNEELDGMEEYRLKDVKDAVRGAEVSLEFKTN